MRKLTLFTVLILCLITGKTAAQETFEEKAKMIAAKIDAITKEEKAALKEEVEAVNVQLQNGEITNAEADEKKMKLAEARAKNIETRIADAENELGQLVKDRVDGKIKDSDSSRTIMIKFDAKNHRKDREEKGESRTTTQFVFAFGVNNLVTDKAVAHSDFKYWGSQFMEWGITSNTRILKESNLLHAKYGFSVMYNNLKPTDNRYFVEDGNQTILEESPIDLDCSRFKNVYLVLPLHLEFDFTKKEIRDDKSIFRTHKAFRFGIGGYAGANIKSKQKLKFEDSNNNDVNQKTKGDFNVNDFIYGVSTYIGFKETTLYVKYDLNPLFKDNAVDQNNISMGIRFDIN